MYITNIWDGNAIKTSMYKIASVTHTMYINNNQNNNKQIFRLLGTGLTYHKIIPYLDHQEKDKM